MNPSAGALAAFRIVGYSLVERSWEYTAAAARIVFTFLSYVLITETIILQYEVE
jgi:hypothetical protein